MKSKIVELNNYEVLLATRIGVLRNNSNIDKGVTNQKKSDKTDEEVNIMGVKAEFAACKYLNVYPDFSLEVRSGSYDLKFLGSRVDVKTSDYDGANPHMFISPNKKPGECDRFLETHTINDNTIEMIGWMEEEDALVDKYITSKFGHGPTYAIPHTDLKKVSIDNMSCTC